MLGGGDFSTHTFFDNYSFTIPSTFTTDSSSKERSFVNFFLTKLRSRLTCVFPFGVWGAGLTGVARFGWDIELNKPGIAPLSGRNSDFLCKQQQEWNKYCSYKLDVNLLSVSYQSQTNLFSNCLICLYVITVYMVLLSIPKKCLLFMLSSCHLLKTPTFNNTTSTAFKEF